MKSRNKSIMNIVKIALLSGVMTLLTAFSVWAKPPDEIPGEKEAIIQSILKQQKFQNPYCKPKLKALKQEIRQNKKMLAQSRTEEEQWPWIKQLYDLHEDLKETRSNCLSVHTRYEVDGTED